MEAQRYTNGIRQVGRGARYRTRRLGLRLRLSQLLSLLLLFEYSQGLPGFPTPTTPISFGKMASSYLESEMQLRTFPELTQAKYTCDSTILTPLLQDASQGHLITSIPNPLLQEQTTEAGQPLLLRPATAEGVHTKRSPSRQAQALPVGQRSNTRAR